MLSYSMHSSSPWTGVVVPVVVSVVDVVVVVVGVVVALVVAVVVGVVDSSSPVVTNTLVILPPPDRVTVIPVLVMASAAVCSTVRGSSLYALAISVVPMHSRVTLVIWSRRIALVAAIVEAISS